MNVRMMGERLSPSVQDGDEADPGAEPRSAASVMSASAAARINRP